MPRSRGGILEKMFADAESPAQRAAYLEEYKTAIFKSISDSRNGDVRFNRELRMLAQGNPAKAAKFLANLTKSLTSEQVTAMQADLAGLRSYVETDLTKDWTPSSPISSGLVPYDLVGPAEVLVPHETPIRNSVMRLHGQGNARKFKRIDSYTNAGIPGGAAAMSPFFNSTSTTSTWGSGNIALNRPRKITYTGSDHSVPYVELGYSDSVAYVAQFEALGFDDLLALSHTALLWTHLLGEERAMLYSRGSGTGYEGAVAAPSNVSAVGASTGGTIGAATYYVYITALAGWGESVASAVVNTGALTGSTNEITITWTEPTGALQYNVYVGTSTGPTNCTLQATGVLGNTITLTAYAATATTVPTSDTTADANGYDGYLSILADPAASGYVSRVNANLSTSNPGVEFDTALTQMWTNNGADPEEIWTTGAIRTELNQLMREGNGSNGAASGYRTTVQTGDNGVTMSTTVTGYVNPATGRVVDVNVHRFQPKGTLIFRATSLPIQDAHVPAPAVAVNVQDYMALDWADIQMSKDSSTYQVGTFVHHAPAWSGCLLGIK